MKCYKYHLLPIVILLIFANSCGPGFDADLDKRDEGNEDDDPIFKGIAVGDELPIFSPPLKGIYVTNCTDYGVTIHRKKNDDSQWNWEEIGSLTTGCGSDSEPDSVEYVDLGEGNWVLRVSHHSIPFCFVAPPVFTCPFADYDYVGTDDSNGAVGQLMLNETP